MHHSRAPQAPATATTRPARRRLLAGALLTAVTLTAGAAPAAAAAAEPAEVSLVNGYLIFQAGSGQINNLLITGGNGVVRVTDVVPLRAGQGCTLLPSNPRAADCRGDIYLAAAYLEDGSDTATLNVPGAQYGNLYGGAGNDVLRAEVGHTMLFWGGAGDDTLRGGAQMDVLDGGPGADVLAGGANTDSARYDDRTGRVYADLDGQARDDGEAGEHDTIGVDVESIVGGAGADLLTGGPGRNGLHGGPGDDVLYGLGGDDAVNGDAGADMLFGGDGPDSLYGGAGLDIIDGGAGADTCNAGADGADLIDCQTVNG